TRPKDRLVILSSAEDWNKSLSKIAATIRDENVVDPFTVINFSSYSECILSSLIRHPDAHPLRNAAGISAGVSTPCNTPLNAKIIKGDIDEAEAKEAPVCEKSDAEIIKETKERINYVYPYAELDGIVAKRIASKLDVEEIDGEYFASRKPSFIGKDKLTPAQRGIATHRFMQFADYENAGKDVEAELEKLVADGMLTEAEAKVVDKKAISVFFESELAKRILGAEKVFKEYSFTASIPLNEIEPSIKNTDEVIIIEGVADCAFIENGELVIVDFKTDKASQGIELAEKYKKQLSVYRRCLAEVIGIPVKQTLIYSFRLSETVEIP
ncbi:MAG: PD-(D/E)XK nuclease family protein, partial [Acutalibacteraceae bacterium]|nr:PD-(D/E)XK nuclease family protein [Acutalibacteraceae bacterium]